jgi:hypothetical protein
MVTECRPKVHKVLVEQIKAVLTEGLDNSPTEAAEVGFFLPSFGNASFITTICTGQSRKSVD